MGSYEGLDPDFQSKLMNLIAASNGRLSISSGFRSNEEQQILWDEAVAKYGEDGARQWVAPPGKSNHNTGMAADLSGDLQWAKANAAAFGLYFPMDWEDWHIEPIGTRNTNTSPANVTPPSTSVTDPAKYTSNQLPPDTGALLAQILGINPTMAAHTSAYMPVPSAMIPNSALPQLGLVHPPPAPTNPATTASDIDRFMAAIRSKESGGDYSAYNSQYGASGAYQFLDGTWAGYGGYQSARDAPSTLQDEHARSLMLSYYAHFGNWSDVASAWYSGPGGDFADPDVSTYSSDVLRRMG